MTTTTETDNYIAEISFGEMVNFLRRNAALLVAFTLAGIVCGFLAARSVPKQWEAVSYFQMGQIQFATNGNPPVLLEPLGQTAERVRLPFFQDEVLRAQGQNANSENAAVVDLIRRGMNAVAIPSNNIVQFVVQGYSPEQARAYMQSMQAAMLRIHEQAFKASTELLRTRLAELEADRIPVQKQLSTLTKIVDQTVQGKTARRDGGDTLLMLSLLEKARRDSSDALERERVLKEQLNPARTFPSKVVGEITVSDTPVKPRTSKYLFAGAVFGIILGLLLASLLQMRRRV